MSLRTDLEQLEQTAYHWAISRAGYMLAVLDQREQGSVTQSEVRDYMWDVMRRLDEDAGTDDLEVREQVRMAAMVLGEIQE